MTGLLLEFFGNCTGSYVLDAADFLQAAMDSFLRLDKPSFSHNENDTWQEDRQRQ